MSGFKKTDLSLCKPLFGRIQDIVSSDAWVMEEKFDGTRVCVDVHPNEGVRAWGRRGEIQVPPQLRLGWENLQFALDGELLGDRYIVFDVLSMTSSDTRELPLLSRKKLLDIYDNSGLRHPFVEIASFAQSPAEKVALLRAAMEQNKEGVVLKEATSTYKSGRTNCWRKFKFYKSLDAVVLSLGEAGHPEAARLGLCEDDDVTLVNDIGGVKLPMIYQQRQNIKVGDVIEVRYLYVTDERKLYQPTFLRKRIDKDAIECTVSQLVDLPVAFPTSDVAE